MRAEAIEALREVMQRKNMRAEDFTKDFLQKYLSASFNSCNTLCRVKEVQPEDAEEVRKQYASTPEALREEDEKLYLLLPINYFTANSLLNFFTKAADKREALRKEAADQRSAAEKEAAAAEKEAKRVKKFEEMRKALAKFDAEQQQKAAQAEAAAKRSEEEQKSAAKK